MTPDRRVALLLAFVVAATILACGGSAGTPSRGSTAPRASTTPSISLGATVPSLAPFASGTPSLPARASDVPSRLVVTDLGIDLPVVSGDVTVPGNPPDYPLCDVAHYLTTFRYPGRLGTTTWIYGHAREGMLLPLLRASERNDGAELIGAIVDVYSTANIRYRYRITDVVRHATDRSAAQGVPGDQGRLILQTSEGPSGTVPKLQVLAELVETIDATPEVSQPSAAPRGCYLG